MGTQEIVVAIVVTVVGGLLLDFFKTGLKFTKKFLSRVVGLLNSMFRFTKRSRLLVYLSAGGTCRDPMAKVITERVLKDKSLLFKVRIEAMAIGPVSNTSTSYAARNAIKEMYGKDILICHTPKRVTREVLEEADLVLVMSRSLLDTIKDYNPQNTYVFKEFFGLSGDIADPWPDGKDQSTLSRYRKCAEEMKKIIEENSDRLIQALQA